VGSAAVPQVNLYSVVVPQRPALNRGPWEALESAVRALVLRRAPNAARSRPAGHRGVPQPDDLSAVWVLSGTLYEARDSLLTPLATSEPHLVPTGFWTVVAVHDDWAPSSVRAAAFAFRQTDAAPDPLDAVVSIDEVEARSGLDLFRLLPDAVEGPLEATRSRAAARALLFPSD
jgi:endonuclease G, mitochondrial